MARIRTGLRVSGKHLQIDKANATVVIAVSIATALVIFCLFASKALIDQARYQNKVIGLLSKADDQLEKNIKAVDTLQKSYNTFESASESVIGTADKNSKIVLDALPSKYDFPALATSLEGIISGAGGKITSITGKDNEESAEQDSINPKPIAVPFDISATGNYAAAQKLVADLERSIRPVQIKQLSLSGTDANITENIKAVTYYQPEKRLEIEQKVVTNGKTTAKKTTAKTTKKAN